MLPIALQVTSNDGVGSLVVLSVFDVPVSEAACRSGAVEGVGVPMTTSNETTPPVVQFPATSQICGVTLVVPTGSGVSGVQRGE
jgi:hypothetical protein